jgi:hypothetical protein
MLVKKEEMGILAKKVVNTLARQRIGKGGKKDIAFSYRGELFTYNFVKPKSESMLHCSIILTEGATISEKFSAHVNNFKSKNLDDVAEEFAHQTSMFMDRLSKLMEQAYERTQV